MRKRSQNLRDCSGIGDSSVVGHLRSAKECDRPSDFWSCIHIAHPDGLLIPFDTYNLFYREGSAGYEKVIQMNQLQSSQQTLTQ
ncbi:MAG: hypothetical protein RLP02_11575 [Coleofasciculus sp. C2-GNP5-27]